MLTRYLPGNSILCHCYTFCQQKQITFYDPDLVSQNGQTPLAIAQRLGYISVVETLKVVTETTVQTTTVTTTEEKYKVSSIWCTSLLFDHSVAHYSLYRLGSVRGT